MKVKQHDRSSTRALLGRATLLVLGIAAVASPNGAIQAQGVPDPPSSAAKSSSATQASQIPASLAPMSETLRSSISKVVLMPGESPAEQALTGSYRKSTKGLYDGMVSGSTAGTVSKDVGPVSVSVPIPILTLPGMIAGGVAGATKREIQEFRDALTEDLVEASSQQLNNDKIALDVFSEIRTLPNLDPQLFAPTTPIPGDTDAILYINIKDVSIDVQGNEAIITTTANATMHRRSDETDVYQRLIQYQDRDTLSDWTENGNAVWRDYVNFARHYIGREISSEVFDSVALKHTLLPTKSSNVKLVKRNSWNSASKSLSPTLAWELNLPGGDADPAWASGIDESQVYYDIEIYDSHRPVYSRKQIPDPSHTVAQQLEACQTYRWSVRPSYHVGGDIRYGPWMRPVASSGSGNGNVGKDASEAPAYLYDFASLKIKCGSK